MYDVQQVITDKIIAALESGTAPWTRSWKVSGMPAGQHNGASGHAYQGVNLLMTWATCMERGYSVGRWLTMKQAEEMGGTLKKGVGKHYIPIVWWGKKEYATDRDGNQHVDADGNATTKAAWILRYSFVYNVACFDGLPERLTGGSPKVVEGFDRAREVVESSGIDISYGGDRAFYSPGSDRIQMPNPQAFESDGAYYATLFHEMTHATGHDSRVGRSMGGAFGSDRYAAEELVAELGAAFLCAETGVDMEPRADHASYIASWLKVLKADKTAVFTAAGEAKKACAWVMAQVRPAEMAAK